MRYLLILVFGLAAGLSQAVAAPPKNIVWIISDDLGVELGCYGEEHVRTPHLDRLADGGTRFTRAYSASPVCSSSRTSFATGCYQTTVGGHQHRTFIRKPLPEGYHPISHLFEDAGFYTSLQSGASTRKGKLDYNFTLPEDRPAFMSSDRNLRAEGQGFFTHIHIGEPHRAFTTPLPDHLKGISFDLPPQYPDHPVTQADWGLYLAHIETLDRKVGEVLDQLAEEGDEEETAVFFFGDHGRPHLWDKQWLTEGGLHVPLIIRWPDAFPAGETDDRLVSLIDLAPTSLGLAGLPVPDFIQGRDLCDGSLPEREFIFAARDRCGDAHDRIRSVRGERFKYVRNFRPELPYMNLSSYKKLSYPAFTLMEVLHARGELSEQHQRWMAPDRPAEELYDLDNDPHELNNLAANPEHQAVLEGLRGELDTWIVESGDPGGEPEFADEETAARHAKSKEAYYLKAMGRRGLDPEISPEDYLLWWEEQLGIQVR